MHHVVGNPTISVSHDHVMGATTDAGPLRSWRVTTEGPGVCHAALIGIASSSAEVSDGVVATIVEHGMLTTYPGSRDNDPFAAAAVRTLQELPRNPTHWLSPIYVGALLPHPHGCKA